MTRFQVKSSSGLSTVSSLKCCYLGLMMSDSCCSDTRLAFPHSRSSPLGFIPSHFDPVTCNCEEILLGDCQEGGCPALARSRLEVGPVV